MKIDNKNNPAAAQINGARGRDVSDVKNKSKNSPAAAELNGTS